MDFSKLELQMVDPMTPEEELLEAKAWGFETVEEFHAHIMEGYEEEIEAMPKLGE